MSGVGRPEGYPKTGGRQKGTPNKRTQKMRDATEIFEKHQFDPIDAQINLYHQTTDMDLKARIAQNLTGYMYPKLTSQQVDMSANVTMQDHEIDALREELLDAAQKQMQWDTSYSRPSKENDGSNKGPGPTETKA